MNNNISDTQSLYNCIYISERSDIDVWSFSPWESVDELSDINKIQLPFHLSTTIKLQEQQRYRNKSGFTGQDGIDYVRVSTLTDLLEHARVDVSGSLFVDNYRGKNRMIETDVLIFDVDNHLPQLPKILEDETLHLSIDKFLDMFHEYEFVISTSLNHQKQKGEQYARDKFHVFMPLDRKITDENEVKELIEKLDYYIKSQVHDYGQIEMGSSDDYSLIDAAVGAHSQVWGNDSTNIYYNNGGSIYDLLYKEDFSNDYSRYRTNSGKRKYRRYKENQTFSGDYELNKNTLLDDFDYVNIISRKGLNHFYNIAYKMGNYYMGYCDLHDDNEASLQIFENGGFNCLGCLKKGISALKYESLKTKKSVSAIRKKYLKELGDVTHQDFQLWLDEKGKLKEENESDDDENLDGIAKEINQSIEKNLESEGLSGEEVDEYFLNITSTGRRKANRELYEELQKMNERFAFLTHNGKFFVMYTEVTERSDYRQYAFSKLEDFKKRFKSDRWLVRGYNAKGQPILKEEDLGSIWEVWEHRRQYDGIDFWPYDDRNTRYEKTDTIWDYFDDWETATKGNKFKGEQNQRGLQKFMDIGVLNGLSSKTQYDDAKDGCKNYLNHLSETILGNYTGNNHNRFFDYFIAWMSRTLTHHGSDRAKVVPVLRGKQGCGKGIFVSRYGQLFGNHYMHILTENQLIRNFNMQMMYTLLCYVNEAVFAGNKQTMNRLKGLITEDEIQLEEKFMPSFMGRSHLRFIYSSNEDWVVPIEWDNRRYWMLECSDRMINNSKAREYWQDIVSEWNVIGKESLFKFLTSERIMDLAKEIHFEFDMPTTSAASNQLIQTDSTYGWIHDLLSRGGHYESDGSNRVIVQWEGEGMYGNSFSITPIFDDYMKYCRSQGKSYLPSQNSLSRRLGEIASKHKFGFRTHKINMAVARRTGSTRTQWQFMDMDRLRDIWVKELFNGSYDDANFAQESSDNLDDFSNDGLKEQIDSIDSQRTQSFDFSDTKTDGDDTAADDESKSVTGFDDEDETMKYFKHLAEESD